MIIVLQVKSSFKHPIIIEYKSYQQHKTQIKPESYNFLPQTSKCHQESYYDCLALELDKFDFNQTKCTKKCIPKVLSYKGGRNYSTPFCQTGTDEKCAKQLFKKRQSDVTFENNFTKIIDSKCKQSCTILQYSALEVGSGPKKALDESHDLYEFRYEFGNADNKMKAFHEYLIYDSMGMIGSVGGTFGMFIGFSMTGVISTIIEFFKESKIGRNILV